MTRRQNFRFRGAWKKAGEKNWSGGRDFRKLDFDDLASISFAALD